MAILFTLSETSCIVDLCRRGEHMYEVLTRKCPEIPPVRPEAFLEKEHFFLNDGALRYYVSEYRTWVQFLDLERCYNQYQLGEYKLGDLRKKKADFVIQLRLVLK